MTLTDIGLLLLRLGAAFLLFFGHGLSKITHFSEMAPSFPDPLGMGPTISFALVVFAEVACTLFVAIGFVTRWAVVPILIFFAVAFFIQHAADPWPKKELVLLYAGPFLTLLFTGPGQVSADAMMDRGRIKRMMSMERR